MLIGTNKEKLHEHYFVFPFKCDNCGNVFMLERGLRKRDTCYDNILDRFDGIKKYEKYCGICAQEIIKKEERSRKKKDDR